MPDRWLPTDPRQREIHRLLLLVGGEPAAFFLDAARLMDGDYPLQATTHVVGHLLRELNLVLRDVLRPMVSADQWPPRGTPNANTRQIELISDALGIDAEDPFRTLWREYAEPLHEWAHRYSRAAPRPVDDDFRELWTKGQVVVHQLARRIEANYTRALPLVDELAAGPPDVARFRQEVVHSTVVLDRFYERAGVDWLEPLREEGVFARAPELVYEEDGSVSYARWPQGRFLARIAPEAPDAVVEIALALTTDNPEAHETLLDAALTLAPMQAARLVPKVGEWLTTPVQWQLPFKTQELVAYLVTGGEVDAGLQLLRSLIGAARIERDRYLGAELVRSVTANIFPTAGIAGLETVADLLDAALAEDRDGRHDYSYIWRPSLAGERGRDLRDALVSALRDGADALVTAEPGRLREVMQLLERREPSIFDRLAVDLLTRHPDSTLIAPRLTSRALFDDLNAEREYDALAAAHYGQLEQAAKEEILGFIAAGPTRGGDDAEYAERWRLQMLERLPELPDEWQQRREELRQRFGPPPERLPDVGFVGPTAPLERGTLAAMSVDEIVVFLRDWQPPEDDWRAPSREGAARVLRQLVAEDPERFAVGAPAFSELDPTYAHALVSGLREAKTNGRTFDWPPVLEFTLAALDKPRRIEGRDPTGFDGNDPGWNWTWQELAYLIGVGFEGEGGLPHEERERIWRVLARLAEDPHPTREDEDDEDVQRSGPPLLAINSVRGAAFEAVVGYIWWLRDEALAEERHMADEARELLDRHLDSQIEPTAAIRSLYGKWFPHLATADPAWAAANVTRIFAADAERLWRAAFESYLYFNGVWENVFRLLIDQYRRAIELLAGEVEDQAVLGDIGTALVNHLMTALRHGMVSFADESGLLELFYERASPERRAEAIESIGHGLDREEVSDEMAARVRDLWERRLAAVQASDADDAAVELRGFAWWFASGKLDAAWSLDQLIATVEAGGRIHPDHLVAERLAALRSEHLPAVLRALELLIEAGTRPWFALGARNEIESILVSGLAADGEPAERARDIVNRLVARGHIDYQRLLQR